jgi:hypothetical protein
VSRAVLDIIDSIITKHSPFAEQFVRDIGGGAVSEAQAAARAQLYAGASVESYEITNGAVRGAELPYYPADGGTECHSRCRCWWAFEESDGATNAYWQTAEDAGVCDGCLRRESESDPFVIVPGVDIRGLPDLRQRRTPLLKQTEPNPLTVPR